MSELDTPFLRQEPKGLTAWCVSEGPAARNALTVAICVAIERAAALLHSAPTQSFTKKRPPSWAPPNLPA